MSDRELQELKETVARLEAAVSKNAAPACGSSLARARRGQRLAMWLGAVGLCSVPLIGWAAVSLTEFQAGTAIVAADVNENFAALAAAVNAGQRIEISQLETSFQCATSSLCLSKNLEVTLETDGTRAVRVELIPGALDSYINLNLGAGGQTDCQSEPVIQRSTDGGDWEDVYRSALRFVEAPSGPSILAVPVGVVTFVDREAGAGVHTYRVGARVPNDAACTFSVSNARLAASDAGEVAG
ncbi:MAG: hypothetical protein IPK74_16095 [Deltaproteobacteria bacterium]|nr:hypothetical protein [Deltaproteobacteria bacterium]